MYKLPSSVLNELHCAVCSHYLSVGPIRIERNGAPICGRCKGSGEAVRTQSYDVLASIFAFPCKNYVKGCKALVRYSEVYNHEINCSYAPGCCFCCRHPCSGGKYVHPDEATNYVTANETLLKKLSCYSCRGFLASPPISLTPNGENICHRCLHETENLPRNIPLEVILQVFKLRCSYHFRGCSLQLQFGDALRQHEFECDYGRTKQSERSNSNKNHRLPPVHLMRSNSNRSDSSNYSRNQDSGLKRYFQDRQNGSSARVNPIVVQPQPHHHQQMRNESFNNNHDPRYYPQQPLNAAELEHAQQSRRASLESYYEGSIHSSRPAMAVPATVVEVNENFVPINFNDDDDDEHDPRSPKGYNTMVKRAHGYKDVVSELKLKQHTEVKA